MIYNNLNSVLKDSNLVSGSEHFSLEGNGESLQPGMEHHV